MANSQISLNTAVDDELHSSYSDKICTPNFNKIQSPLNIQPNSIPTENRIHEHSFTAATAILTINAGSLLPRHTALIEKRANGYPDLQRRSR